MSAQWALILALPAAIAAAVIALLARTPLARRLVDHPNHRSLHESPTPRIGGLGVMAGAVAVAAWFGDARLEVALACSVALALLSAVDDWRSLPVPVRLPAHIAAAAVGVAALASAPSTGAPLGIWTGAGLVLAVAWMTNLYNFMDGADGLAASMAVAGFGAMAIAAAQAGAEPLAACCAAIASAAAGFLVFNFPPARIFLGDSGSVPLGFLAGLLGASGALQGAWAWWFPVLAFSPFIVDATLTLVKRLFRGERIWIAHREHYYQRLVLHGWAPRRLALSQAALMGAAAASALLAREADELLQCGIILGWLVLYGVLSLAIEFLVADNKKNRPGARKSNGTSGEQE